MLLAEHGIDNSGVNQSGFRYVSYGCDASLFSGLSRQGSTSAAKSQIRSIFEASPIVDSNS